MSINLGIYDVFANIVPGLVYLYVLNEYLRAFNRANLDLSSTYNLPQFLLLIILAYLVGYIMDYVSYHLWFLRFYSRHEECMAYQQFKERYPELDVVFVPEQSSLLFTIIRQKSQQLADSIDKNKVVSLMLRNTSFALILLLPLELYFAFANRFNIFDLTVNFLMAIGSVIGSLIALRQAERFDHYFYRLIFENAALEGKDLKSIVSKINKKGIGSIAISKGQNK